MTTDLYLNTRIGSVGRVDINLFVTFEFEFRRYSVKGLDES